MARERVSFCRICGGGCGIKLTVEDDGRISSVRGDPDNPMTRGYACFKGLQAEAAHHGPERLLRPLKRQPDGTYAVIPLQQALSEIADRIGAIIAEDGPSALANFCGNGAIFNALAYAMQNDFLRAMGSRNFFSTLTIDQSSKTVALGRLGVWRAGPPDFEHSEVALFFGANPLVSHASPGFLAPDPTRRLKAARARGLKLIVVDPRRTETARNADLFAQPFPGQDVGIAAALIRLILAEGWEDAEFCARYVGDEGMARLRAATEPFTAETIETRAGLEPGMIRRIGELFAHSSASGAAHSATGTCMAPWSVLAHQLVETLNVICGRYLREGERVHGMSMLSPAAKQSEGVLNLGRFWEAEGPSRIRGAYRLGNERPTGTLSDEILTPGEGRIRSLIVDGGDPMTSWPDRARTKKALKSLDLLVAIDPWPSLTTSLADYVIPPLMQYERADLPLDLEGAVVWPGAWAQYTPPVIPPPPGSELVNDWYVFWSIAARLGQAIDFCGAGPLDMTNAPSDDEMIERFLSRGSTTLDELRRYPHGRDFPIEQLHVLPALPSDKTKFDVMADDVAADLARFRDEGDIPGAITRHGESFRFLLSSRRMRDFFNSNGRHVATIRRRSPSNPAYLNPDDMAELGLSTGDQIDLTSAHGRARATVACDPDMRKGVISIAHGWGGDPDKSANPFECGTGVNDLIDIDERFEPVNAMPHMSAVPVNIELVAP